MGSGNKTRLLRWLLHVWICEESKMVYINIRLTDAILNSSLVHTSGSFRSSYLLSTSGQWFSTHVSSISHIPRRRAVFSIVYSCCLTRKTWVFRRWNFVAICYTSFDMWHCICIFGQWRPCLIYQSPQNRRICTLVSPCCSPRKCGCSL